MTYTDALLLALAAGCAALAWTRPALRPVAAALVLLAALALAHAVVAAHGKAYPWGRVDVALLAAWPGVVAALLVAPAERAAHRGCVEQGAREPPHGARRARLEGSTGPASASPSRLVDLLHRAGLPRLALTFLPLLAYAAVLGFAVAPRLSPAALRAAEVAPRIAVGLLALAVALRRRGAPWTPSQRVGVVLAAGQVAGVVAGLWSRWEGMRVLAAVVWLLVAGVMVSEARRDRERP